MILNWIEENAAFRFDLAIEEPFVPFNIGRIGAFGIQNRFLGMLYTTIRYNHKEGVGKIMLVHPRSVKLHLTGKGNATKDKMVQSARKYLVRMPARKAAQEALADAVGVGKAAWEYLRAGTKGVSEFESY